MSNQIEFNGEEEKFRPSDLRAHAHVLVELGLMPLLEKILEAVADARFKHRDEILRAAQDHEETE